MSTVWITRTQPGANDSAQAFQGAGLEPVIASLLEISAPDQAPAMPPDNAVLIFTSQNGVHAFAAMTDERHWSVITVGDATQAAAQRAGFECVRSAGGTSDDVVDLILKTPDETASYLHCAGRHVRGQITERLTEAGFKAERHLYYNSSPVKILPSVDLSGIDIIALYSPLAAKTLGNLLPDGGMQAVISISSATDQALNCWSGPRYVARVPTQEAMIAALTKKA